MRKGRNFSFPRCSKGTARNLMYSFESVGTVCQWHWVKTHEVFLHVQLNNLKIKKVIRTTSFCLNLHESIFRLMDGLCHSLGKKGLSHRQHFEVERCASSVSSEAKYGTAGSILHRTERNKSV